MGGPSPPMRARMAIPEGSWIDLSSKPSNIVSLPLPAARDNPEPRFGRYRRESRRSAREQRHPRLGLRAGRSEEHTSELQSLMRISYAVFCLKKKQPT